MNRKPAAVIDQLARHGDKDREGGGEALHVTFAEVVDQPEAVGEVLVELDRDQGVVDLAVGDGPEDDARDQSDHDEADEHRVGARVGPGA